MTGKQLDLFTEQDLSEVEELRRRLRAKWAYDVQSSDPQVLEFLLAEDEEVEHGNGA